VTASSVASEAVSIPARDGFPLTGTLFRSEEDSRRVVIINPAMAVPARFYRHFAAGLAAAGYTSLIWDYRGIASSKPGSLRGFDATVRDWVLLDLEGVVDWVADTLGPDAIFFIGHSLGGQVAGLLEKGPSIDGMATMSAQSGHWRFQGGEQKLVVLIHTYLTLPVLSRLFGYMPWGLLGAGEDLPRGVALEWAAWCRNRRYVLGDPTLPLHRYRRFTAPVLAYSFGDDKWGTPGSVEEMMRAYPNVERRHVEPGEIGLSKIGHVGYFKPDSHLLWQDTIAWLDRH
jgi:predicted alpha/beta hydrolase